MTDSVWKHPDLKEGEVFIRNDGSEGFKRLLTVLKTARQGTKAFNINRALIQLEGFKPIFCQKEELDQNGGESKLDARIAALVTSRSNEPVA